MRLRAEVATLRGVSRGWVSIPLSGAQLILIVVGLIGVGVFIGRRWPS